MIGLIYRGQLLLAHDCGQLSSRAFHSDTCRRPFSLLIELHILSDGPNFKPIYFIIMSDVNSNSALPSIS